LEKEVDEIEPKDLPKGVQAVATAAAISVDKAEARGAATSAAMRAVVVEFG